MKKDLLIINGKCLTMSDDDKEYSWMLIRDDNIQDMGWGDDYKKYIARAGKVIDAKKGTVLPVCGQPFSCGASCS